ncbi:MAG: hypothetical protein WBM40_20590 [Thiohalocapsa sp.]
MPAEDRGSWLAKPQRAHVASTGQDARDDYFGVGEPVVHRVVMMEVDAEIFGQSIPTRPDLRNKWRFLVCLMMFPQTIEDCQRRKVFPALLETDIDVHWHVVVIRSTVGLFEFGLIVKRMSGPLSPDTAVAVDGVHWIAHCDVVD